MDELREQPQGGHLAHPTAGQGRDPLRGRYQRLSTAPDGKGGYVTLPDTSVQVIDYVVNNNGNLRSRTGGSICDTFSYDQANRLTGAVVNSCGTSTTSSYAYNGDGLRLNKTVASASTRYLWDVNRGLPVVLEDGTRKYAWGAQGLSHNQQLGSTSASTVEVYHADQIGTIRELSNGSTGELTATYTHDEFGVPTQATGSSTQPFRYTGELWDGGAGEPNLLYLRARSYEPGIGRFIQRDPVGGTAANPCTLNSYIYANNSPLKRTDPSGRTSAAIDPFDEENCNRLLSDIEYLANNWPTDFEGLREQDKGLAYRFYDMLSDPLGIWDPNDLRAYEGHRAFYQLKQEELASLLREYDDNCPDPPTGSDAWATVRDGRHWLRVPAPAAPFTQPFAMNAEEAEAFGYAVFATTSMAVIVGAARMAPPFRTPRLAPVR